MHIATRYTKSMISAFFLLLTLSLFGCSSDANLTVGSGTITSPEPIADLAVTSTAPADAAADVATNVKVVAVFNKALKAETVTDASFTLVGANEAPIVGSVSYNPDTMTASLDPTGPLSANTLYTATITTDVDVEAGESLLENFVWTFTTGDAPDITSPTVASTSPEDGATGVVRNIQVNIVFDEAIDPDTVTTDSVVLSTLVDDVAVPVSGSVKFVNPDTVVFTPDSDLGSEVTYTMSLTATITDIAGNALADDMGNPGDSFSFTTSENVSMGPDPVNLGTAGNYVILAETSVSTTGTTFITGDVAVFPEAQTALTGFSETLDASGTFATSDLVDGRLFAADMTEPTPTNLNIANLDMKTAFTDAAGRTLPDFTELGAGEIGGLTLDPGLYKWSSGVLITSDVTLTGDANDVWIFQIAQDLKIEDGKSVILAGGALPENVFWQVSGEVTLQAGTAFNGIILSQTAIIMRAGAELNGRALAQTAVTLISNTVTEPAN